MNNYMELYVNFCKGHEIWFAVCTEGSVDQYTFMENGQDTTIEASRDNTFGSKAAYELLVGDYNDWKAGTNE